MEKVIIKVGKSRITILKSEYDPKKHKLYKPKKEADKRSK